MRNCASGLQAIDSAYVNIIAGRSSLVLAGGTDAMSHAPVLFGAKMVNWLGAWYAAKSAGQRAALATRFRPSYLVPVIALLKGLTDPNVKVSMGSTAEIVAARFGITRRMMDEFAVESHRRTAFAQDNGHLAEVEPMYGADGTVYTADDGVRRDSSVEKLAKLKPVFDRKNGSVTAGNSSQVTDGAVALLVMSEARAAALGFTPLGVLAGYAYAGCEPARMGLGPLFAIAKAEAQTGLTLADADLVELNEAFAAQTLAVLKCVRSEEFARAVLRRDQPLGEIPSEKLNVNGGAIALGHPVGATGARLVLTSLKELQRRKAKRALVTLCVGGGQGAALWLERM
jgi:acetyl-CoA C-acetyltransferase